VRVREERYPSIGDKFCSRCGQKGTIGLIIPESDMPFTAEGIRPDLIINPHALPSRMTIGQLIETLMGKAGTLYGAYGDCTGFVNKGPKHEEYGEMLSNMGYHSSGNEVLYNGMNGEQMESDIFIGPSYYMRLKHMVKDKINYRTRGPRTALTRQTVQGRANDGGLRIGEMERDAVIGNGLNHFLNESHMVRGDEYYMAICNNTGTVAIYNEDRDLFLSPGADGPIKFTTAIDDTMNVENVSRYGRSFSIVRVPYTFKLLMQELGTMNISMRIITEDNINQLYNMSYSNNVDVLNSNENILKKRVPLVNDADKREEQQPAEEEQQPKVEEQQPAAEEQQPAAEEQQPAEEESPNITMDITDTQIEKPRPEILTAVSKEPLLNPDIPSPEFYVPYDPMTEPEKYDAFVEMRRKEEEERKEVTLLTDVAEEEEEPNDLDGEKKFIINN
jgi:DNA-directed RNA polymerase II subunit RPB2